MNIEIIEIEMTPQEFLNKYDCTNEAFAHLIGVTPQTVDNWKSGKRNVSKSHLRAIAFADYFYASGGHKAWFDKQMLNTKAEKKQPTKLIVSKIK